MTVKQPCMSFLSKSLCTPCRLGGQGALLGDPLCWNQADLKCDFSIQFFFLHEILNISHPFSSLCNWPQTFHDLGISLSNVTITAVFHLARLFSCVVFLGFEYLFLWDFGFCFVCLLIFVQVGIELKVSYLLSKCSITDLCS